MLITDPLFCLVAISAVLIVGIAKGGFGGGLGIVGVPLMALAISPLRAAAILLPILLMMDLLALRAYWRLWDRRLVLSLIPGAVLGTVLGAATFSVLSADGLRMLVGLIAFVFAAHFFLRRQSPHATEPHRAKALLWSTLSGYTSFSVHAGGPPLQVYLLPLKLDKTEFQATTVAFFFIVNWFKLPFFLWLGQLDRTNITTSLMLAPLAPLGIWLGRRLHDHVDDKRFYLVVYVSLLLIGGKLIWDGLSGQ